MLAITGILIISSTIILIEFPYLHSSNNLKEIWVFSILLLFATGLGIAMAFQVKVPNPIDGISFIYRPVSDVILRIFT
ncbi:hypothetical protein FC756_03575 [Lysinibacillus mangiferihumi]|uniref:Uncharacterized protein n=1 Tax=Lysinibacillus mangiferihumi TaxID=1130819 RepID=A0A4U2ZDV2_9BACI|nr:hypothetical protein [Lysinibacillus mangiferihumi]TKI71972.1 hypothetical protein FC756_03575 [Lysinibacillus mangiferihumi]